MKLAYQQSQEDLLDKLSTNSRWGLTSEEAVLRAQKFGKNVFPTPPAPIALSLFLRQFMNPLIYVLIFAAVLAFSLAEHIDAVFIFIVLFINAIIGFAQEYSAEKS